MILKTKRPLKHAVRFAGLTHLLFCPVLFIGLNQPAPATAQTAPGANGSSIDFLVDRINAARATGPGGLVSRNFFVPSRNYMDMYASEANSPLSAIQFGINVSIPWIYNSNPSQQTSDGPNSSEVTPDIHFGAQDSVKFAGGLQLSGSMDLISDRYPSLHSSNADILMTNWQIQHVSGHDDQEFQPYISYGTTNAFATFYGKQILGQNLLSIGFDKAFDFKNGFVQLKNQVDRSLDSYTIWQIAFTGYIGRNYTTGQPSDWEYSLAPSISYNGNNGENFDEKNFVGRPAFSSN